MNPETVLCEMEFYGMSDLTEEIAANQVPYKREEWGVI